MRRLASVLFVFAVSGLAAAQDPFPNAPPEQQQNLRQRVNAFYSTFQQGDFREAESYVAEESRDVYYNAPKTQIFSYEIRSVEFNPDLTEANVLVAVESLAPLSSQPLKQPLQSQWIRVDGEWYMHLRPVAAGEAYPTPFGPKHFSQTTGKDGAPPPDFKPPNLASMQTAYQVSERNLRFAARATEPQTRTITVQNKFESALTIDRLTDDFPGMEVKVESDTVPRGGAVTISFTYHPEQARLVGNKHFDFNLMPITQRVRVVLSFR